jgi:hypothetical protein
MPTPIRCASTIVFDFEGLLQEPEEILLQRFELVRRVHPMLVTPELRTEGCRITRAADAITFHFYQQETPQESGTEIFRFRFEPVNKSAGYEESQT